MKKQLSLLLCCLLFAVSAFAQYAPVTIRVRYTGPEVYGVYIGNMTLYFASSSTVADPVTGSIGAAPGNYLDRQVGYNPSSVTSQNPYYLRFNTSVDGTYRYVRGLNYSGSGIWEVNIPNIYEDTDYDIKTGEICFTNTFAQNIRVQITSAMGAVLGDELVTPGSSICYSADSPFFFKILETTIDPISGEPEEKTTFQWEFDGTANQSTNLTSNTATPRKNPGSSNPLNPTPANDTQAGVNGIVNQLQDNRAGEAQDLAGLAGILEQIRDKVATNQPAGDTNAAIAGITSNVGSFSNQVQGAGLSASNSVHGELTGQLTGADGLGAAPSWSFTIGDMFIDANPFAVPEIETLRVTFRTFVLFLAKLLVLFYVWKEVQETMSKLAAVAKGSGTSGFLQAALLSVPQLVTTIAGLGIRWKVVLIAIPLVAGWVSKTVLGANAIPGVVATFAALAPTDGALLIGYQMFFHVIPLAGILSLFFIGVMAVLGLRLFLIVISVIVDVTSKA